MIFLTSFNWWKMKGYIYFNDRHAYLNNRKRRNLPNWKVIGRAYILEYDMRICGPTNRQMNKWHNTYHASLLVCNKCNRSVYD